MIHSAMLHFSMSDHSRNHDSSPVPNKDMRHRQVAAQHIALLAARSVGQAAKQVLMVLPAAQVVVWFAAWVAVRAEPPLLQFHSAARNQGYPASTAHRYSLAGNHRSWGH